MKMKRTSESERAPTAGRTHIHNVRFYNLQPRSIQVMAYNKIWKKLAVSRNDGSIEIWDVRHAPCLERTIPKSPENSVEGLAWSGERLFSAGLNGELIEWNLQTLKHRFKQHVTGNAIWCLDVNREGSEIAIGSEEGYINIFNIEDDQFQYKSLFDKQEGRVLCCRFDATGNFLVTGSMGAIRIWDTRTGHAIHKMTVTSKGSKSSPLETIIWSLQVLRDFTIISGDSRGHVSIWDGKTASQIETHQVLKADVLAVAVNEEEDKLFCAGIEPTIRVYAKTQIRRDDMTFYRWVKFLQRRVHDHDVKALVYAQENIYSGGVDGYLGISSATKTKSTIVKYGPFLQQPCVTVAAADRLLLLRYPNSLEIWRMGSTNGKQDLAQQTENGNDSETAPKILSLNSVPEKLVEFKSKNEDPIVCSTLAPNGRWLCYSTHNEIRLFHFVPGITAGKNKRATQLIRVKDLPEQMAPASHIHFTANSMRLIVVNRQTKQIMIFTILSKSDESVLDTSTSPALDFIKCIDTSKHIKDSIKLFAVSLCGSYMAAASADRSIAVWSVDTDTNFKHLLNLPRYTAATTALTIHDHQPRLVAAFADGKIFEYDLDEMCFTCSDVDRFMENSEYHCINNIIVDDRNPNIFVMQNDSKLFVLEKCKAQDKIEEAVVENSKKKSLKKARTSESNEDNKVDCLRLKIEKTYEHLLHLCWLSPEELVAVCANPVSLIEQLPSPFKEKIFRTM